MKADKPVSIGTGTRKTLDRLAAIFLACVCAISLLAAAGWLFHSPVLASLRPEYIPMAPASALLFLGLCGAWLIHRVFPDRHGMRILVQVVLAGMLVIVILLAIRTFTGSGPDLEKLLYPAPPSFGQFTSARMSPLSAPGFFLAIAALFLLTGGKPGQHIKNASAALSIVLFLLSGLICLGYLYGMPPFYGGTLIPVAITTALAFLMLSLGLLLTAGPDAWPVSMFTGHSIKARLMRILIPASLLIVLLQGLFSTAADPWVINPAIKVGVAAFVACLIVMLIISFIANNLSADIERGRQAQSLQEAVYRIAAAAETTISLDELYPQIHQIISSVMQAQYFYITLYDEAQNLLRFPYFKDAEDEPFVNGIQPGKGLTAYVLRTGKSLLCTQAVHDELERQGEVKLLGVPSAIWLGVPLIVEGKTIGAMVVQHYSDPKAYGEREQHMLEFVSTQVAIAINRKRAEEALRQSEAELRALFASMNDMVIVYDTDGRAIKIAPTNPANLYRPSDDMLGKTLNDILPKEQAAYIISMVRESIQKSHVVNGIYALQIDGRIKYFSASASRLSETTSIVVSHDITERRQAQILQEAVYRIAAAAEITGSLDELYPQIHQIISSVMPAENFFITLYDEAQDLLRFPYFKDAADEPFVNGIQPGKGLTAYVLRTGKSLLCTQAVHDELERQGEVKLLGVPSAIWLGVPLIVEGKTIGAMVVQHYSDPKAYGEREQHMLEFVSTQVAIAINRKRAEEALKESQRSFQALVEQIPGAIYRDALDEKATSLYFSPQIKDITGYSPEEWLTDPDFWFKSMHPDDRARLVAENKHHLETGEKFKSDYRVLARDGRIVWVRDEAIIIHDSSGHPLFDLGIITDITERKRMEEEIRTLSMNDELTGLYNRRGFTLLAEHEVKLAHRLKRTMMLFFGDVDDLKAINDTHGHPQGDLALMEVATILRETFREADILARFGGDEFVVLAVDASLESAETMTNRIQDTLDKRNQQGDRPYQLTLSMGFARCDPEISCTVGDLVAQADGLMYAQKHARKGKQ